MKEVIFHKILGYNDNFYVSNYGSVFSVKDNTFLREYMLNNGRMAVDIEWNGRKYMYMIDRLVVNTHFGFTIGCLGKPILDIIHKDGDLTNNCAWNLEPVLKDVDYVMKESDDVEQEKRKNPLERFDKLKKRFEENINAAREMESQTSRIAKNTLPRSKKEPVSNK